MNRRHQLLTHLFTPLLWLVLPLAACDTSVKTDEAEIGDAVVHTIPPAASEVYTIDTAKSTVTWIGAKITGRHNGVFKISSGELLMDKDKLTGGHVNFDMKATRSDDRTIDEAANIKLTTHLRSADFFDVANYPNASFTLTGITPYDSTQHKKPVSPALPDSDLRVKGATHLLTGNLTIKDKTRSIRFPARVIRQDSVLRAMANFNIDRTKWGLVYRADQSLGNQTIHPQVNIGINLEAKRTTP